MQNNNLFLIHKFWEIGVGMAYYFHFLLCVIYINYIQGHCGHIKIYLSKSIEIKSNNVFDKLSHKIAIHRIRDIAFVTLQFVTKYFVALKIHD